MAFIRYCTIIIFLITCSLNFSHSLDPDLDLLLNDEKILNIVESLRSRRHIEPFDIYKQSFSPDAHKRKRGFLANLKQKILSFIAGNKKKNQRTTSIPDEDENTNDLESSHESDTKVHVTTIPTHVKSEKNLNNADLVSRLRKMLTNYEHALKTLKEDKISHHKCEKTNSIYSHENEEVNHRKKRHLDINSRKKTKQHYFHAKHSNNKVTTKNSTTFPGIGSHAEDHNLKKYKYLEETKRREEKLKRFFKKSSHKAKFYEQTKINKFAKKRKNKKESFSYEKIKDY